MAKYFLDFPGGTEQSFEELFWEQNNFPQIIQILCVGHNVLQGLSRFLGKNNDTHCPSERESVFSLGLVYIEYSAILIAIVQNKLTNK